MSEPSKSVVVRASGGVVIRGTGADAELAVVHRPRYDDWTLPKGKDDPGETPRQAALREVQEETGIRCRVVGSAGVAHYQVGVGPKRVKYFLMRPLRSTGLPENDEVDEVRWVSPRDAGTILTYDFDRDLIGGLDLDTVTACSDIHLVRHGAAGDRAGWEGSDHKRPLTAKGIAQAAAIASGLGDIGITRVISSPYVRCVQTVEPLANRLGVELEVDDALAEGPDRHAIARLLDEVAGTNAALSSHGDVIPTTLEMLRRMGVGFPSAHECRKGSTWSVAHDGAGFTDAIYTPPPTV